MARAASRGHTRGMNETTPPAGGGFFPWLRSLGITRSTSERWFAGVAGGIAARAGIDPLIVRGIFVVLAVLGGPGLLLYLAGWLLLPDQGGRIHVEELVRGRAQPGVIIAAVIVGALLVVPVVVGVVGAVFGGPAAWDVWNIFGTPEWLQVTLAVVWWAVVLPAGIIWLIVWISRGGLNRGPRAADSGAAASAGQAAPSAPTAAAAAATASGATATAAGQQPGESTPGHQPGEGTTGQQPGDGAPDWGQQAAAWGQKASDSATAWAQQAGESAATWGQQVGADTTAWAERERLKYEARKLGAGQLLITLALALMAAGAGAVWALSIGADSRVVYTTALVAGVAVCALSMIIAGVRGRNSGWVGFIALVGAIALVFTPYTSIMPDNFRFKPLGDTVLEVTEDTPQESGLAVFAGDVTLDLASLDARDAGRSIEVWLFAGNVEVELPRDHPTRITVHVMAGNTTETSIDDETRTTRGPFQVRTTGANLAGAEPEETTEVQVRMFAGNVEIEGTDMTNVTSTSTSMLESEATR